MRKIKAVHKAAYQPIGDLQTFRATPTIKLKMNSLDPFILLDHHGPQVYPANNKGLPFGLHPHRGMQTVSFILKGGLNHTEGNGFSSLIKDGGIQWMIAGKGIIHAELAADQFMKTGGTLHYMQLWLNLPASLKMTQARYFGLQAPDIPIASWDNGKVTAKVVSGIWNNVQGPIIPLTDVALALFEFKKGGTTSLQIGRQKNILFYLAKGTVEVNDCLVSVHHVVEFDHEDTDIHITAKEDAIILIGHASPYNEPIATGGPFVMNTEDEINQAYSDIRSGKFDKQHTLDSSAGEQLIQ